MTVGGIVFLVGSVLPWWELHWDAAPKDSKDAKDFLLTGMVPLALFLGISVVTVIARTNSLRLPDRLVRPKLLCAIAVIGTAIVAARFMMDSYPGSGATRGQGLFIAGGGSIASLVGTILAVRDGNQPLNANVTRAHSDDFDDDELEDADDVSYDYSDHMTEDDDVVGRIDRVSPEQRQQRHADPAD